MPRSVVIGLLVTGALAAMAYGVVRPWQSRPPEAVSQTDISTALRTGAEDGFTRATRVRPFQFPRDHGPHPDFRTEWWYFTGNLETRRGRRFGYELALFRLGLKPRTPQRPSAWGANHIYMGHFALTDVANQRFHFFERFARGAAGLAGARAKPFAVWLEDWSVRALHDSASRWELTASAEGLRVTLEVEPVKPVVPQGERGLSRKSAEPGNASYYYSITRLATQGRVTLGDETHVARGTSWLDREWSTSALGPEQAGWDWFGLQLEDNSELMFYRLRRRDGTTDPHSMGAYIDSNGRSTLLHHDDVGIEVLDYWSSPAGGRYPSRVRLTVIPAGADLEIKPVLKNQELDLSVRYWEGAVGVSGRRGDRAVNGWGYMELTGYAPISRASETHQAPLQSRSPPAK